MKQSRLSLIPVLLALTWAWTGDASAQKGQGGPGGGSRMGGGGFSPGGGMSRGSPGGGFSGGGARSSPSIGGGGGFRSSPGGAPRISGGGGGSPRFSSPGAGSGGAPRYSAPSQPGGSSRSAPSYGNPGGPSSGGSYGRQVPSTSPRNTTPSLGSKGATVPGSGRTYPNTYYGRNPGLLRNPGNSSSATGSGSGNARTLPGGGGTASSGSRTPIATKDGSGFNGFASSSGRNYRTADSYRLGLGGGSAKTSTPADSGASREAGAKGAGAPSGSKGAVGQARGTDGGATKATPGGNTGPLLGSGAELPKGGTTGTVEAPAGGGNTINTYNNYYYDHYHHYDHDHSWHFSLWWGGFHFGYGWGWCYPWYAGYWYPYWHHCWYYPYYHYYYYSYCPVYYPYAYHYYPYYRASVIYYPVYSGYSYGYVVGDPYVEEAPASKPSDAETAPESRPESAPDGGAKTVNLAPGPDGRKVHPMVQPLAVAPDGPTTYEARLEAGDRLLSEGRHREAAEAYRLAALDKPGSESYVRLAFALIAIGEHTFAGWALEAGLVPDDGGMKEASLALSRTFAKADFGRVIGALEKYIIENPNDELANLALATVYTLTDRHFGAVLLLRPLKDSSVRKDLVTVLLARSEARLAK